MWRSTQFLKVFSLRNKVEIPIKARVIYGYPPCSLTATSHPKIGKIPKGKESCSNQQDFQGFLLLVSGKVMFFLGGILPGSLNYPFREDERMANVWSFSGVALIIWHCLGWCHIIPKKRQLFFAGGFFEVDPIYSSPQKFLWTPLFLRVENCPNLRSCLRSLRVIIQNAGLHQAMQNDRGLTKNDVNDTGTLEPPGWVQHHKRETLLLPPFFFRTTNSDCTLCILQKMIDLFIQGLSDSSDWFFRSFTIRERNFPEWRSSWRWGSLCRINFV